MLASFAEVSNSKMRMIIVEANPETLDEIITKISKYIQNQITNKKLNLSPIRYKTHYDTMTRKERIIGVQHPLHQICDYVAVNGMKEVLNKKIGVFQCASIPNKGQSYGKKQLEKWVRNTKKPLYFIKGDITKCFPSIKHEILIKQLNKDIKNDTLIWFISELLKMFDEGLSIGSYLSQYLSNYYLSQAYHYICNVLFRHRKTKSGHIKRVRLVKHTLFYMDDFILLGHNKRDLRVTMIKTVKFMNEKLELKVKDWKVCKFSDTEPIDMMGFVFRKNRTTIRTRIFLKTRKKYLKVAKHLENNNKIPIQLAYSCISAYGWYKHTDSFQVIEKYNINYLHKKCKETISNNNKERVF